MLAGPLFVKEICRTVSVSVPIQLKSAAISAINSNTPIQAVSYNGTVLQISFTNSGPASITMLSSQVPLAVYADNNQITTWSYANGVLSINADPSFLTIVYSATTPITNTEIILIALIAVIAIVIVAAIIARKWL